MTLCCLHHSLSREKGASTFQRGDKNQWQEAHSAAAPPTLRAVPDIPTVFLLTDAPSRPVPGQPHFLSDPTSRNDSF